MIATGIRSGSARAALEELEEALAAWDERRHFYEQARALKRLSRRVGELNQAREYLEGLARLTQYTRSRMAYEQSIIRPTREQESVLSQMDLRSDFLVKGAAGTGKTLVLLKALEKAKRSRGEELDLTGSRRSFLFLTYNKTLAKYNQYVASLLIQELDGTDRIGTVDSFFGELLQTLGLHGRIDYGAPRRFAEAHAGVGELTREELAQELEEFILGNIVSREEYIDRSIQREGMGKPLSKERRREVWDLLERWIEEMEA